MTCFFCKEDAKHSQKKHLSHLINCCNAILKSLIVFLIIFSFKVYSKEKTKNSTASNDTFYEHLMKIKLPEKYKLNEIYIGKKNAPVELIIYSSYTCTQCRIFHTKEFPKFKKLYVDTGKARVIFRNYLDDQGAMESAQIVRCFCKDSARNYFELSNKIYSEQVNWLKSTDPEKFLRNIFVGKKFSFRKKVITEKEISNCLKKIDVSAGLMIEQKQAMHQLSVVSVPAFIVADKIRIGKISCEELAEMCGL